MNHIVKSYDRDLEEVLGEVTVMGRLVREQLVKAADALEKLDADEARSVMTRDAEVNGTRSPSTRRSNPSSPAASLPPATCARSSA